jgi:hypothetical protein
MERGVEMSHHQSCSGPQSPVHYDESAPKLQLLLPKRLLPAEQPYEVSSKDNNNGSPWQRTVDMPDVEDRTVSSL